MNLLLWRWTQELLGGIVGVTAVLVLVLSAGFLLRLMGDVVEGALPLVGIGQLLLLSLPQLLTGVLPLSTAVVASLCLGRWWQSSEMVAARYIGLSDHVSRMPVWIVGAGLILVQSWVGISLVPYSEGVADRLRDHYRSELVLGWVSPGVVHKLQAGEGSWRLAAAGQEGGSLRDVLLFRTSVQSDLFGTLELPDGSMTVLRAPLLQARPCQSGCSVQLAFPQGAAMRSFDSGGQVIASWELDRLQVPLGQGVDPEVPLSSHLQKLREFLFSVGGALSTLVAILLAVLLTRTSGSGGSRGRRFRAVPIAAAGALLYTGLCLGYAVGVAKGGSLPADATLGTLIASPEGWGMMAIWYLPIAALLGWGAMRSREWQ